MANPLGSTDPDDFLTNVGDLDRAINTHSSNENPTHWTDRRGATRWTWYGFETRIGTLINDGQADIDNLLSTSSAAFDTFMTESQTAFDTMMTDGQAAIDDLLANGQAAFDDAVTAGNQAFEDALAANQATFDQTMQANEIEFQERLASMGYQPLGDYDADGPLTIEYSNQVFTKDGEFYRPAPTLTLPYTTVDDWTIDEANFIPIGDAALRSELGDPGGVKLVSNADIHFPSVGAMIAAAWLGEGDEVETSSYYADYWGLGGNRYSIRAPSSSYVPDLGSVIELNNGLVAVGLFPKGIYASQWGIRDENTVSANTTRLQAWADFVGAAPREEGLVAPAAQGFLDVDLNVNDTLLLRSNGANSTIKWFMQGGYMAADADTFPAGEPMVTISAARSVCKDLNIAGHSVAGSVLITASGVEFSPGQITACVSGVMTSDSDPTTHSVISAQTANIANQITHFAHRHCYLSWGNNFLFGDYGDDCTFELIGGNTIGYFSWEGTGELFRLNGPSATDKLLLSASGAADVGIQANSDDLGIIAGDALRMRFTAEGHLYPAGDNLASLGTGSSHFKSIFVNAITGNTEGDLPIGVGGSTRYKFTVSGHFTPSVTGTQNLGSSSFHFNQVYTDNITGPAGITMQTEGSSTNGHVTWTGSSREFHLYSGGTTNLILTEGTNDAVGIAGTTNGNLQLLSGDGVQFYCDASGHFRPAHSGTQNLGSTSTHFNNFYVNTINGPAAGDGDMNVYVGGVRHLQFKSAGGLWPVDTGVQSLGSSSFHYKSIYVDNVVGPAALAGTVQDLTAVELRVGAALVPKRFQADGTTKRYIGFVLPEVEAAFAAEGLDAVQYGAVLEEEDEGGVLVKVVNHEQVAALALAAKLLEP